MDYKRQLDAYLSTCAGGVLNVFYEIYQIIKSVEPDSQPEAVMYFVDTLDQSHSDESHEVTKDYYTEKQLNAAREKFRKKKIRTLITQEVNEASKNNVPPIGFYRNIWGKLTSYCKNDREAAYVLFTLVDHRLIPYRGVGIGVSMSDEEYEACVQKIGDTVFWDTMYIFQLNYEQKTQYASLLVDKLLALEDRNLQTVYMSLILKMVEKNMRDRLKSSIEDA